MKNKTILLGLNELNFEYIKFYISLNLLPNFKKLFDIQFPIETISENDHKLLEPWIQWVTIHTGKNFDQHKVFRLGDIVNNPKLLQIFEELEAEGLKISAISPFNAENRLINPGLFIPDPWTKTNVSGNWVVKLLYKAIHQTVNDNANSKLSIKSIFSLAIGLLLYIPVYRWLHYIKLILKSFKPGYKSLILDNILADINLTNWKKYNPDFSYLFLNAGAHIQHHYLFNSSAYKGHIKNPEWYCPNNFDPLIQILSEYDYHIGILLKLKDVKLIIATGLHQKPHEHLTFYWRLKNHKKFCDMIGIENISDCFPRMSRDFLLIFKNDNDALNAEKAFNSFYSSMDNLKIFEIDNRGTSLFIELVYPNNIDINDSIYSTELKIKIEKFKSYISFVAIKNGEHSGIGYVTSNFDLKQDKRIELRNLKSIIKNSALI